MIGEILDGLFGRFLDGFATDSAAKRKAKHSRDEGRVLGAMRVSIGETPGLSRRWRGVDVLPGAGVIEFDLKRLTVLRAFRRVEPLSLREELKVPVVSSPVIIDLHVPGASLEWAIPEQDAEWVIAALQGDTG